MDHKHTIKLQMKYCLHVDNFGFKPYKSSGLKVFFKYRKSVMTS
jgi:hypothetical protein